LQAVPWPRGDHRGTGPTSRPGAHRPSPRPRAAAHRPGGCRSLARRSRRRDPAAAARRGGRM